MEQRFYKDNINIAETYSDFTRSSYRQYLRTEKDKLCIPSYKDFNRDEKFILWRHDINFSVIG